ncbi:MAG: hypothetical protein KY460_08645 [Actinobacteria bacterium]|nr:hypothetical protein [Actinomycetota bacterium]
MEANFCSDPVGELPVGLRGLVVAGLLAALMSSLSSVFNSTSTLITWDIYREWKPQASDRELVWVGRAATVGLTAAGFAWIPFMDSISTTLYQYLQSVQSYISPPIAAVFLLGLAWKRINATGAMASLLIGFVLGAIRLVLELMNGADQEGLSNGTLSAIAEFNCLHFAIVLFVICVVILIVVSLATGDPEHDKVAGLTFETADEPVAQREDERREGDRQPAGEGNVATKERSDQEKALDVEEEERDRRRDVFLSIGVAVLVALVWIVFA